MKQCILKKIVFVGYLIFSILLCSAETMEQKDHFLKMNLPEGWQWIEQVGQIRISDPKTGNAISIQFAPSGSYSNDEIKELLKKGNQAMIERIIKPSGGTAIKDEERQLGGVYARQLNWAVTHNGQIGNMTYISMVNKGHAFTITFGGPDTNQVAAMKKSVETIQFE